MSVAEEPSNPQPPQDSGNQTATDTKPQPAPPQVRQLPPWKVVLHNDDVNAVPHVVETIINVTTLSRSDAMQRTYEAHQRGKSLLLTTHLERGELYVHQFAARNLTVTLEKA